MLLLKPNITAILPVLTPTVRMASRDEGHFRESALQLHDQRMQIQEVAENGSSRS